MVSDFTDVAFEVTLDCSNCGCQWDQQYPSRTVVENRDDGVYAIHPDDEFTDNGREQCPTCELYRHADVDDRQPIDESDFKGVGDE
jgi:hypothetical protein